MKSDPEHLTLNAPSTTAAPMQDHVSSTGNVSATFQAPGLISIPSDGISHDVTIAKLNLDAKMSWVCVPKEGATTYFTVSIYYYEYIYIFWYGIDVLCRRTLRTPRHILFWADRQV